MMDKIKKFIDNMNKKGISFPVMTDPATSKGSITATLVVISSACVIASLLTKRVDNSGAFEFFVASISVYTARKFQSNSGSSVTPPEEKNN